MKAPAASLALVMLVAISGGLGACRPTQDRDVPPRVVHTGGAEGAADRHAEPDAALSHVRVPMHAEVAAPADASFVSMDLHADVLEPVSPTAYTAAAPASSALEVARLARIRRRPGMLAIRLVNSGESTLGPLRAAARFGEDGDAVVRQGFAPALAPGARLDLVLILDVSLDDFDRRRIDFSDAGPDVGETAADTVSIVF